MLIAKNAEFSFKPLDLDFSLHYYFYTNLLWPSTTTNVVVKRGFFMPGWFLMSKLVFEFILIIFILFINIQEKIKRIQQIRLEKELRAQQILEVPDLIQQHL